MNYIFKRAKLLSTLTLFLTVFVFTACSTSEDAGTGTLKVSLTDAPANYEQVNIDVRQILVNKDGISDDTTGSGWEVIMNDSMVVNLLDYQNGKVLELGEAELEAGRYNQIRLLLGENNNVVIDGETIPLKTPSAQQSGYKLNVQADVEAGQVYDLVIDFDASQSIVQTGNGGYILKPVLRTVNLQEQASISGNVLPLDAKPFVYAIMDEDTVGTQADDEGFFRLIGLSAGTYNILIEPTSEAYADSLIEGIELEDGEQYTFEEDIQLQASGN